MALILGNDTTLDKDFSNEKPSEDQHTAICIGIWPIGAFEETYQGRTAIRNKLLFRFEVAELMPEDDEKYKGKHKCINRRFTATFFEKGKLRPCVDALIGKKLSEEELETFDLETLIGKGCLLDISHEKKGDRVVPRIENISKLPKEMKLFKPDNLYENGREPEWLNKVKDKAIKPAPAKPAFDDNDDDSLPFDI